jgi:hypothetical protein
VLTICRNCGSSHFSAINAPPEACVACDSARLVRISGSALVGPRVGPRAVAHMSPRRTETLGEKPPKHQPKG